MNILLALYADTRCHIILIPTIPLPGICALSKFLTRSMFTAAVFGNN